MDRPSQHSEILPALHTLPNNLNKSSSQSQSGSSIGGPTENPDLSVAAEDSRHAELALHCAMNSPACFHKTQEQAFAGIQDPKVMMHILREQGLEL